MKILTFDCYGTLLNTAPLYSYIEKLAEENLCPPDRARKIFENYEDRLMYGEEFIPYDKLLYEILTYCDMELNTDAFSKHWEEVIRIHKSFLPFPDAKENLRQLKAQGYSLAIMSNSTREMMGWHLEKFHHLFDGSLVAEDTRCYKPCLSFFRQAEEYFSLAQKEHIHIAAGYWWDIVPASRMGWNKIWVNRKGLSGGRKAEQPYQTVRSLDELKNLL